MMTAAYYTNHVQTYQRNVLACSTLENKGVAGFCYQQANQFKMEFINGFNMRNYQNVTRHATKPITSQEQLVCFNTFYFARHWAAIQHVFSQLLQLPNTVNKIKVIDYGCGQGLATMALLDYLSNNCFEYEVHLIEPSALAIRSAEDYITSFAKYLNSKVSIVAHNTDLNSVAASIFETNNNDLVIHLYSNVLDIAVYRDSDINIATLTNILNNTSGLHLHIGASPTNFITTKSFNEFVTCLNNTRFLKQFDFNGVERKLLSLGMKNFNTYNYSVFGTGLYVVQDNH